MLTVVETLQDLVRIPSVNPMGRDLSGSEFYETRMTDHLEGLFGRLGLPHERQEVAELRSNIIARLDGSTRPEEGGELLMFEAHQDTVPVDGMTIEPWSGDLRDGRVYGRGACDIKGGMACMLAAISRLAEQRPGGMPTIVMACSVNEEHGYSGATELAKLWSHGQSAILPRRPDAIVVAEPTMLDVVVAHKGVVRWRCRTHGRACHSSQPELGDNAIYRMSRVIAALEKYAREICPTLGHHPLLRTPTLSIGTIVGGISVNTVPDESSIEIDRRLLPDENPDEAYRHIVEYISRETKSDP
ncbi:MAG: M20/M25/M40 family metallo-hydrolase, partial [Planctomycetes bacterium]|nr:M20/M25/M40 family metallo-hydrolase [Planctomycetota bacterium]